MKKWISISLVLVIALLFTGCAGDTLPDEDTEQKEHSADSEAQGEVIEGYSAEKGDDEKYNESEQQEPTEDEEAMIVILSDEELARLRSVAEEYYISINRKMISFAQADPSSPFIREYEGYGEDEVVLFVVSVENSENNRYITIGSKDGWNNCSILNEGY